MKRPFAAYQGDEPYVFVCYAHEDAVHVYPEIQRLHEGGVRIWYDEGISPGTRWSEELARQLSQASLVLFFCTPQSVKSTHCQTEIDFAIDQRRPLLVIQEGHVDLPLGLRFQLAGKQSILKHELSAKQYADKLIAAISPNLVNRPDIAPMPKVKRSRARRLSYVAVAAIAAAGLTTLLWRMWPLPTSESRITGSPTPATEIEYSVAVLPFRSSNSEPATVTFARGLTDELINELSGPNSEKIRRLYPPLRYPLRVASAQSTLRYQNTSEDLATIGQSLGSGYLVEGSVRSAGERARVALQLVHAADNDPVWSHSYDASMADPLQAQNDIARHAARRIAGLVPDMYREGKSHFANAAAQEYYVRGNRVQMDMITGGDVDAFAMLANIEKSLELDPAFVWTYENVVSAYLSLMEQSMEPVETVAPIEELLDRATALIRSGAPTFGLSESLLRAHRAQNDLVKLDYANADKSVRDALREKPDDLKALQIQAILFLHRERPDEALASYKRDVEAGGATAPDAQVGLALLLRARGKSGAAVKAIESALELYPGELGKAQLLIEQANAYLMLDEPGHAAKLVDQAWDLCGANHPEMFAAALAATGRADRARAILRDLEAAGQGRRFNPVDVIEGYVARGDLDAAFRWIDRAVDARFEPVVRWMHLVTVSVAGVWPPALTSDYRWQSAYNKLPTAAGV
jgi:TolB-like protein